MREPTRRLRSLLVVALAAGVLVGAGGPAVPAVLAADPSPAPPEAPTPSPAPSDTPLPAQGATPVPLATPTAPAEPEPTPAAEPTASPSTAPTTPEPSDPPDPSTPPDPSPSPAPDPSPSPGPTAGPDPSPSPGPSDPPPAAWPGRVNLYRRGAWVRQYWDYTCTAASTQTMLNLILGRSERSSAFQQRIIRWARRHDSLRQSRGSDPQGWARALTHFGGGSYGWRTFDSRAAALRYAAARIVVTGKPVGLLVWRGRHAWTMTGFTSATDPSTDPRASITGIYVAPPLRGVDPKPNAYLRTSALGTFARYRERDGLRAWIGHWVVVAP